MDELDGATKAMLWETERECLRFHVGNSRWFLRVSKGRLSRRGEWKPRQCSLRVVLANRVVV